MNVNYLTEIIRLDEWELTHPLSPTAYKVMRKLYHLANFERFPEWIKVPNPTLMALVGCTETTLATARMTLINMDLIDYKKKGKGKGATLWYRIHYFSLNPLYNHKNQGNNAGENNGESMGNNTGENNGENPGQITNRTKGCTGEILDDEDDLDNDNDGIPAEDRLTRSSPLHNPSPVQPTVGVNGRAREDAKLLYPPRTRRLTNTEWAVYDCLVQSLTWPDRLKLFGGNAAMMLQIFRSDRFPLELVAEAMERTVQRDKKFMQPLMNPVAYTLKLLEDWEQRGFKTVRDINEAKDNYWDDY